MEIADNIGSRLTCGAKAAPSESKPVSDDDEDVIEPDIDVGTYDDIVDESENNNNNVKIEEKVKTNIPLFTGFLIEQLLGRK